MDMKPRFPHVVHIFCSFLLLSLNGGCVGKPIGPRIPDAASGLSLDTLVHVGRDETEEYRPQDGASKYLHMGQEPKLASVQGSPIKETMLKLDVSKQEILPRPEVAGIPTKRHQSLIGVIGEVQDGQDDQDGGQNTDKSTMRKEHLEEVGVTETSHQDSNLKDDVDIGQINQEANRDIEQLSNKDSDESKDVKNTSKREDRDVVNAKKDPVDKEDEDEAKIKDKIKEGKDTDKIKKEGEDLAQFFLQNMDTVMEGRDKIHIKKTNTEDKKEINNIRVHNDNHRKNSDMVYTHSKILEIAAGLQNDYQKKSLVMKAELNDEAARKRAAEDLEEDIDTQIDYLIKDGKAKNQPNDVYHNKVNKKRLLEKLQNIKASTKKRVQDILLGRNVHFDFDHL